MINRQKVIRGLEICSELGSWHGRDCEFNEAYKDCPYRGCETGCIVTIAKDALQLLKEQEPQKMLEVEDDDLYAWSPKDVSYYCPRPGCGKEISYDYNFCPYCGQAVKLDD